MGSPQDPVIQVRIQRIPILLSFWLSLLLSHCLCLFYFCVFFQNTIIALFLCFIGTSSSPTNCTPSPSLSSVPSSAPSSLPPPSSSSPSSSAASNNDIKLSILRFSYADLSTATRIFTEGLVGHGAFGSVFRANIRGCGPYAIKKLHNVRERVANYNICIFTCIDTCICNFYVFQLLYISINSPFTVIVCG